MRTIFFGVIWVGRATVFLVGLAVVLSLTLALVADAAEARVPSLKKGVVNTVKAVTSMVGSVAGPVLRLDNNSTDASATGLDIQVEPEKAPLTVNDTAGTAKGLSADELDGQDGSSFLQPTTPIYREQNSATGTELNKRLAEATCDEGDVRLSGGFEDVDPGHGTITDSRPGGEFEDRVWEVEWDNPSNPDTGTTGDTVTVFVACADFPPLRP